MSDDNRAEQPQSSEALAEISLPNPMIALSGRLICADAEQAALAAQLLPEHTRLSLAEPGCLRFDLWQDNDPKMWHLSELFRDAEAFAAHGRRNASSEWGRQSAGIGREFTRAEVTPTIRPENPTDAEAIDLLLQSAFGGPDEAKIMHSLRQQGDLRLSLVAEAAGKLLAHLALSPIVGDRESYALAPVAVAPHAQGLGIGSALIERAIDLAGAVPLIVVGEPEFYGRFGFRQIDLISPYAGPYLQARGEFPAGSVIRHAAAFAEP